MSIDMLMLKLHLQENCMVLFLPVLVVAKEIQHLVSMSQLMMDPIGKILLLTTFQPLIIALKLE